MTQVVLTATGTNTWTIPSNFGSTNTIEVIGAGGSGGASGANSSPGGGGGGYGKISNISLTPGGSVSYTIATGGVGVSSSTYTAGNTAGDTYFNGVSYAVSSVGAKGGNGGAASYTGGGSGGGGKGDTTNTGGAGGNGQNTSGWSGGGGGGAAGLNGNGNNGVNGSGTGGASGGQGDSTSGGLGGTAGSVNGANGTEYGSYGSGGGGAGGSNSGGNSAGAGGLYGGGGGGGSSGQTSGAGANGLIVINYTPAQYLTLTAAQGSFTLTGHTATFTKTVNVSFATGHYTLTGNAVSFKYNGKYVFGVNTGYFVLTGENASMSVGVNNKILAGIFSLVVSPAQVGYDTPGSLVMESQYSYGLTPAFNSNQNGCLIDNEQYANYDSYYSAWSNSNMGGIDFNDTTLWSNNEPFIETDIIPIGTYLNKKTLGSIEFKLDRPLATGDSISLYWRPSLTGLYIPIPLVDTSSSLISNYGISAINQAQWAQFLITFACASSNSSRIPFRELRLHIQ
jgi:hypothetical protein